MFVEMSKKKQRQLLRMQQKAGGGGKVQVVAVTELPSRNLLSTNSTTAPLLLSTNSTTAPLPGNNYSTTAPLAPLPGNNSLNNSPQTNHSNTGFISSLSNSPQTTVGSGFISSLSNNILPMYDGGDDREHLLFSLSEKPNSISNTCARATNFKSGGGNSSYFKSSENSSYFKSSDTDALMSNIILLAKQRDVDSKSASGSTSSFADETTQATDQARKSIPSPDMVVPVLPIDECIQDDDMEEEGYEMVDEMPGLLDEWEMVEAHAVRTETAAKQFA